MKNKLFLLILLLSSTFCTTIQAQTASLGIDTVQGGPNFPTTVLLGDSASINFKLKNYGTVPFNGPVTLFRQVRDSAGGVVALDSSFIIQVNIIAGTIFPFTYIESYTTARGFYAGIDVVVIWPKAAGAQTHDSILYSVQVLDPTNVSKLLAENGISVYPNPCTDELIIKNKFPGNPIEQVSIYNLNGSLILTKSREERIDLSEISPATYLLELRYKSGMRKVIKVQKKE